MHICNGGLNYFLNFFVVIVFKMLTEVKQFGLQGKEGPRKMYYLLAKEGFEDKSMLGVIYI